jgi:uncharacterized membrane protein (DUF4010 family)
LERERHHNEKSVLAGIRTLPLVSLSGVLLVLISELAGEPLILMAGVLVFGALALFMALGKAEDGASGLTTPVAFIATFLLGVLVAYDLFLLALVGAVAITILLLAKERLHHLADVLSERELRSAVLFVVLAFILYPITPDEPIGPGGVVNLQQALLIVIMVSVLSFASFLAMRRLGVARGIPWMGFLGGLASSMAAAAAIAGMETGTDRVRRAAVLGILAAAVAMLLRNLAIAAIADPGLELLRVLAPAFILVGGVLTTGLLWRLSRPAGSSEPAPETGPEPRAGLIASPFALRPALKFGLLFLGLSVAAELLHRIPGLGDWGLYLTAVGGLVATGPVVASMAVLAAAGSVDLAVAASVSLTAAGISIMVKAGIAHGAGREVGRQLVPWLLGAGLTAWVAAVVLRMPAWMG